MAINPIKLKQIDEIALSGYIASIINSNSPDLISGILSSGTFVGDTVVYTSGDQFVSGQKTFEFSPNIPYSGLSGQAISLAYLNDVISGLESSISGVTPEYLNQIGIVYTTGNQIILGLKSFDGGAYVPTASNPSGAVPLSQLNSSINNVLGLIAQTGESLNIRVSALEVSNTSNSGFAGVSSFNGQSGNIFLQGLGGVQIFNQGNVFYVSGGSGVSGSGIQGPIGPYLHYKGEWDEGNVYSYLDWVNIDGVSWASLTGHLSDLSNKPESGSAYWGLLASGEKGESGLLGPVGPSGQNGQSAILFTWQGNWIPSKEYVSGDAVYLSGSSYGLTGSSASGYAQSPFDNPEWDIVVQGQTIDTSQFYTVDNPSGFVTINHDHDYIKSLNVGLANIKGNPNLIGQGSVTITSSGDNIYFNAIGGGGGGSGEVSFNWRNYWNPSDLYYFGDAVELNGAAYIVTGSGVYSGIQNSPIGINSEWARFGARSITYNSGVYNPNKFYYKNDLVVITGHGGSIVQLINTNEYETPLLSLHPISGIYNSFRDCDNTLTYNLFEITVDNKTETHPYYLEGNSQTYKLNNLAPNDYGSGYGTITLIRNEDYYFDSEVFGFPFILTSDSVGGSFNGQIVQNVYTGARLMNYNPSYYSPMVSGSAMTSGTMVYRPTSGTPNELYYQCATQPNMGWRIKVVDKNPWETFTSGIEGAQGPSGQQGAAGLAFNWRGEWSNAEFYFTNDAVYYSGSSFRARQTANGIPPSIHSPSWEIVARGGSNGQDGQKGDSGLAFTWKGTWNSSTTYIPNEAVFYNGSSWACVSVNINSAPSLSNPNWTIVSSKGDKGDKGETGQGGLAFTWKDEWNSSTTYNQWDAVFFEGSSYGLTSGTSLNEIPDIPSSPWVLIAQRGGTIFSWKGEWDSETPYYAGDAVFFSGSSYATHSSSSGVLPSNGGTWFPCALKGSDGTQGPSGAQGQQGSGVNWRGTYSPISLYNSGDLAFYNGSTYICTSGSVSGVLPSFNPPWSLFAKQAGNFEFSKDFYIKSPVVGIGAFECIADKNMRVTGLMVSTMTNSVSSGLSGSLYYRTYNTTFKTSLGNFIIPIGQKSAILSGVNYFSWQRNLFGVDIAVVPPSTTGLSISILGYYE